MLAMTDQRETPWVDEVFHTCLDEPVVRGSIRTSPESFQVIELLPEDPSGSGEHIYLHITKKNANTAWVADQLALFAGVRKMDVGYAGRKDRHAATQQWFSIYLPSSDEPEWDAFEAEGVAIDKISRHSKKLRPGALAVNNFRIEVTLEPHTDAESAELDRRLVLIRDQGFPNYFGSQRFGRDLHNIERADQMLRYRQKMGGDRGMLMSAARSWLFNMRLSDQISQHVAFEAGATGPLYGKSRDPQFGEALFEPVYQDWIAGLRRLGAKVGERAWMVLPEALRWTRGDGMLTIEFGLPPGCFATSLLQEILVVEDAAR